MEESSNRFDMAFAEPDNQNETSQGVIQQTNTDNESMTTDGQPYNQRQVLTGGSTEVVSVTGELSDEKLVFKLIYRSDQKQANELIKHLNETKERLDVTNIFDRSGYSPLNYAAYKDRYMAFKALIEFVKKRETELEPSD